MIVAQSCAADQAHLRSHSGTGASEVLHGAPTSTEFKVEPQLLRTLILERLRFPLNATDARCECGAPLDVLGRHRTARPRSGRLWVRAAGPERTLGRVCREARATVRCNTMMRDMNVAISANDEGVPSSSWVTARRGHHIEERAHSTRLSVPGCSFHRWLRPSPVAQGQRTQVPRVGRGGTLSVGNWREVEL